jgi:hypothetical protein
MKGGALLNKTGGRVELFSITQEENNTGRRVELFSIIQEEEWSSSQ